MIIHSFCCCCCCCYFRFFSPFFCRLDVKEVAANITFLLVPPVELAVLNAALDSPHSLEMLRRSDSVVSRTDDDGTRKDFNEEGGTKRSHLEDDGTLSFLPTDMDEKNKLRLMEVYISHAQQHGRRKKRKMRDRSSSTIQKEQQLKDLFYRRINSNNIPTLKS